MKKLAHILVALVVAVAVYASATPAPAAACGSNGGCSGGIGVLTTPSW